MKNQHEAAVWLQFASAALSACCYSIGKPEDSVRMSTRAADMMLDEYRKRVAEIDPRPEPPPVKKPGAES